MEIARYLLYREVAFDPTAQILTEGLFCHLELSLRTGLAQKLEICAVVKGTAVGVEPVLFDGGDIGTMGQHSILDIEGDDFTGKSGHQNVKMHPRHKKRGTSFLCG